MSKETSKPNLWILTTCILSIAVIIISVVSIQRMMLKDSNYDRLSEDLRECYSKPSVYPYGKGGEVFPVMAIFNEEDQAGGIAIYSGGSSAHIAFFKDVDEALEYVSQKVDRQGYYSKALVYNLTPISVKLVKEESTVTKELHRWVVDE